MLILLLEFNYSGAEGLKARRAEYHTHRESVLQRISVRKNSNLSLIVLFYQVSFCSSALLYCGLGCLVIANLLNNRKVARSPILVSR